MAAQLLATAVFVAAAVAAVQAQTAVTDWEEVFATFYGRHCRPHH